MELSIKHMFLSQLSCIPDSPGAAFSCTRYVFLRSSVVGTQVGAQGAAGAESSVCVHVSLPSLSVPAVAERLSQAEEAERLHPSCPQRYCQLLPGPALPRGLLWWGTAGPEQCHRVLPGHHCPHTLLSLPGTAHLPEAEHPSILSTESCCSCKFICWGKKKFLWFDQFAITDNSMPSYEQSFLNM